MIVEDKQLIAQYAAGAAEAPFCELARRHINLVYSTALRHVNGDTHLAEDVTQNVFADLARKAKSLTRSASLAGWLYTSARFAAANAVRSESRRRAREEAAIAMIDADANLPPGANDARLLIDSALEQLPEGDKEAVVLRYFESLDFAAVGEALGVSQNAARMRVERSLEKLRGILEKRGMTTTNAVLAATFSEWAAKAAPAELAAVVAKSALLEASLAGAEISGATKLWGAFNSKMALGAVMLGLMGGIIFVGQRSFRQAVTGVSGKPQILAHAVDTPVTAAASAQSTRADSHAFQKLLERHDARFKAKREEQIKAALAQWEKAGAEFDRWIHSNDAPGVKNFGAKIRVQLASGQTLLTGGWNTSPGKRTLALMTPTQIDAAGNRTVGGVSEGQMVLECLFLSAPNDVIDKLNMQPANTPGKESTVSIQLNAQQAQDLIDASKNSKGIDLLSAPRILTLDTLPAEISIVRNENIEGQEQELGLRVSMTPIQVGADGTADLGVIMRMTLPVKGDLDSATGKDKAGDPAPKAAP